MRWGAIPPRFVPSTNERYEELIKEIIYQSDVILMMLDARMPDISRNKRIEQLLKENNKRFIYVLNKIDIAPKEVVKSAKGMLKKIAPVVEISSVTGFGVDALRRRIYTIFSSMEGCRRKVGLLGYPNMGKSSLINRLAKRKAAKVSKEAGFTKGIHWIRGKQMELVDGPGYIETKDKLEQLKLGMMGAQNPEKLKDPETVASNIINELLGKNKKSLEENYGVKIEGQNTNEVIEMIGKRRGHLKKGGEIEERRTAMMIIRDWQSGKLRLR